MKKFKLSKERRTYIDTVIKFIIKGRHIKIDIFTNEAFMNFIERKYFYTKLKHAIKIYNFKKKYAAFLL